MQLQAHISSQAKLLQDTGLHLEDLDNRGRRNNIRIRGLPEADSAENLPGLFNQILGEPPTHQIKLDRALRPKKTTEESRGK